VKPTSVAIAFSRLKTREFVDCRFHDLRVLNGSQILAHHVDLRTISDRLGHADMSITANIYTHGIAATNALAADVIDNVLALGRSAISAG
jgi:integrase